MTQKNPNWTEEELVLTYCTLRALGKSQVAPENPAIINLSKTLCSLDIHSPENRGGKFRSPDGVRRRINELQRTEKWLRGEKFEQEPKKTYRAVVEKYIDSPTELQLTADRIKERAATYVIITENDESAWKDQTGFAYHFPKRYEKYLRQKTKLLYYKGKLKNRVFRTERLTDEPHYFGTAIAGKIYNDRESSKGDMFLEILDFHPFSSAVLAKQNGQYLETIPESQKTNYWRNAVRPVDAATHDKIVSQALVIHDHNPSIDDRQGTEEAFVSKEEGKPTHRYVTTYERNPKLRAEAMRIHGTTCAACGFNFSDAYGSYGAGYIHIHHIKPLSEVGTRHSPDPNTDLVPLCANCHCMVHRNPKRTLSIEELKSKLTD